MGTVTRRAVNILVEEIREFRSSSEARANVLTSAEVIWCVCQEYEVSCFSDLKIGMPHEILGIRQIMEIEKRIFSFVSTFVATRSIATFSECHQELLELEGVKAFPELGIGNSIFRVDIIRKAFKLSSTLISLPHIETRDVIRTLKDFRRLRGVHAAVDLKEFSCFLAETYSKDSYYALGVVINDIGEIIKILRRIHQKQVKLFADVEADFMKDVNEKVFLLAKEKFSAENRSEVLKTVTRNEASGKGYCGNIIFPAHVNRRSVQFAAMSSSVLHQVTLLDSFLDQQLLNYSEYLPAANFSNVPKRDKFLRRVALKKNANSKTKTVSYVLCGIMAKVEVLLEQHGMPNSETEDECGCCCIGSEECSCPCDCECHQFSENETFPIKNEKSSLARDQAKESIQVDAKALDLRLLGKHIITFFANYNLRAPPLKILVDLEEYLNLEFEPNLNFCFLKKLLHMAECNLLPTAVSKVLGSYRETTDSSLRKEAIEFARQYADNAGTASKNEDLLAALTMQFNVDIEVMGYKDIGELMLHVDDFSSVTTTNLYYFSALNFQNCFINAGVQNRINLLIKRVLSAPFCINLHEELQWNFLYYFEFGSLKDFIISKVLPFHQFFVVEIPGLGLMRINPATTVKDILLSGERGNSIEVNCHLLSLFVRSGGVNGFPLDLIRSQLRHLVKSKGSKSGKFVCDILVGIPLVISTHLVDVLLGALNGGNVAEQVLAACAVEKLGTLRALGKHLNIVEWDVENVSLTNTSKKLDSHVSSEVTATALLSPQSNAESINCEIGSVQTGPCALQKLNPCEAKELVNRIRLEDFGIGACISASAAKILAVQHARLERSILCLSKELYSSNVHFASELIQNADDNLYDQAVSPYIRFSLFNDKIVVDNNEVGFSEENIKALCDIGASTKLGRKEMCIGNKGIGFKSVFKVTDAPEIHSNSFHVRFNSAEKPLGYILPIWLDDYDNVWNPIDMGTRLILPFKEIGLLPTIAAQFETIKPSILLFLNKLQSIEIRDGENGTSKIFSKTIIQRSNTRCDMELKCDGYSRIWKVFHHSYSIPSAIVLRPSHHKTSKLSLAFANCEHQCQDVFAFLPLRSYGFRFIVHGNFMVSSSRENLDVDSDWNQWLISLIPDLFLIACRYLGSNICSFIPLPSQIQDPFRHIAREILFKIQNEKCLEAFSGELCRPNELIRSPPGMEDTLIRFLEPELVRSSLKKFWFRSRSHISEEILRALNVKVLNSNDLITVAKHLIRTDCLTDSSTVSFLRALVASSPLSELVQEQLIRLPFVTLESKKRSSLSQGTIYFPPCANTDFFGLNIRVMDTELYRALKGCPESISLLKSVGVLSLTLQSVVTDTIIPVLSNEGCVKQPRDKILRILDIIYAFFNSKSGAAKDWDILKDVVTVPTNAGLVRLKDTSVYFPLNMSDNLGLKTHLSNDMVVLDAQELLIKYGIENFTSFFSHLGVKPFFSVKKLSESVTASSLIQSGRYCNASDWLQGKTTIKVIDWECGGFDEAVCALNSVGIWELRVSIANAVLLGIEENMMDKSLASQLVCLTGTDVIHVSSSLVRRLRSLIWIPGSKGSSLRKPTSCWIETPEIRRCLSDLVSYVHPSLTLKPKTIDLLGINSCLNLDSVFMVLKELAEGKDLHCVTCSSIRPIYDFLNINAPGNKERILQEFLKFDLLLVPQAIKLSYSFTGLRKVTWGGPNFIKDDRMICYLKEHYSKSLQHFFIEVLNIPKEPGVQMAISWLRSQISSTKFRDSSLEILKQFMDIIGSTIASGEYMREVFDLLHSQKIWPSVTGTLISFSEYEEVLILDSSALHMLAKYMKHVGICFLDMEAEGMSPLIKLLEFMGVPKVTKDFKKISKWCGIVQELLKFIPSRIALDAVSKVFPYWERSLRYGPVDTNPFGAARIFPTRSGKWLSVLDENLFVYDLPDVVSLDQFHSIELLAIDGVDTIIEVSKVKRLSRSLKTEIIVPLQVSPDESSHGQNTVYRALLLAQRYINHIHPEQATRIDSEVIEKDFFNLQVSRVSEMALSNEIMHNYGTIKYRSECQVYISRSSIPVLYMVDSLDINSYPVLLAISNRAFGVTLGPEVANFLFVAHQPKYGCLVDDGIRTLQRIPRLPENVKPWNFDLTVISEEDEKKKPYDIALSTKDLRFAKRQRFFYDEKSCSSRHQELKPLKYNIEYPAYLNEASPNYIDSKGFTGLWGEEYVFRLLKKELSADNEATVFWVNEEQESGKPYDIEIRRRTGVTEFVEVKSTKSNEKSMFEISINELDFAAIHGSNYYIYRLFGAGYTARNAAHLQRIRNPISCIRQKQMKLLLGSQRIGQRL